MRSTRVVLALAGILLLPTAAACEGPSPGDQVVAGDAGCTLAFVVASADDLYFATAGHCIQVNQTATSPGVGAFGVGAFHYLEPETGSETDGSPGNDFALIRIDPEFYDRINPKVCGWDGPKGIYDSTPGSGGVRHYGYGLLFGEFGPETRTRTGFNLDNDNTAFYWTGMGVPGDSGSAVLADDGRALGVLTHLTLAPPATNGGTHILRGFQLAQEEGGFGELRLVLMGEDPVKVMQSMRANGTQTVVDSNATGKTNTTTSTGKAPATNSTSSGNSTAPPSKNATTTQPTPGQPLTKQATGDAKNVPGFEVVLIAIAGLAAMLRRRA